MKRMIFVVVVIFSLLLTFYSISFATLPKNIRDREYQSHVETDDGSVAIRAKVEGAIEVGTNSIELEEKATDPSTPDANKIKMYAKDDGGTTKIYTIDSAATVSELGSGGGDFADGGEAGTAARSLGNTDNFDLHLLTNDLDRLHIAAGGNVGIGDPTPGYKLAVDGSLSASGNTDIGGYLQTTGNIGIGATPDSIELYVAGDVSVTGAVTVTGGVLCANIDTGGGDFEIGQSNRTTDTVTFSVINSTGITSVGSNLTVIGFAVVGANNDSSHLGTIDSGDLLVKDDFEVVGLAYFDQTLQVDGDLTVTGNFFLNSGNIVNFADLNVSNDVTVEGNLNSGPQILSLSGNNSLSSYQCTNSIIYVGAGTQELPAVSTKINCTFITIGAKQGFIVPNASDRHWLDGTALADGAQIENTSTAGDIAVVTYKDATGYHVATNGWSDAS